MQMTASTPQTARWLLAIGPDVAELLAVVTLRETRLGSVCFHLYNNVANVCQVENFL
jgi:hypothetical protein